MLKNKKTWDLIGLILGVVILITGIVFALTPPETYSTDSVDAATFGADFYTYQYRATRIVARNAAITANNLREMGEAQAIYFGALFIAAGALTTIYYGKKYFTDYIPQTEKIPEFPELPSEPEVTGEQV